MGGGGRGCCLLLLARQVSCVCEGGAEEIALVVLRLWALSVGGKKV